MRILNATTRNLSILSDSNQMISVPAGEMSILFIGSKNTVLAAIKLGGPDEIGIILGSSYELDLARTISTSTPYLYMNEEEAVAKLIDKNKDYKRSSTLIMSNEVQLTITKKDKEIEDLKTQVSELTQKLEDASKDRSDDEVTKEFKLELRNKAEMIQKLESELVEVKFRFEEESKSNAELKKSLEEAEDKNANLENMVKTKDSELSKLTNNLESTKSALSKLTEDSNTIKDQVESMKNDFNLACLKFNLYKDGKGEWIQRES